MDKKLEKRVSGRKGCRFAMVVMLVFIGIILGLPALLSTGWVTARVSAEINQRIHPAVLSVDSWSLGWFGSQEIHAVEYEDPASGLKASVQSLRIPQGIIPLLRERSTGTIALSDVVLTLPEPNPTPELPAPSEKTPPSTPREKPPTVPRETPTAAPPAPLPAWIVALEIDRLRIVPPTSTRLEDIIVQEVRGSFNGQHGKSMLLAAISSPDIGSTRVNAEITFPDNTADIQGAEMNITLSSADVRLDRLLALSPTPLPVSLAGVIGVNIETIGSLDNGLLTSLKLDGNTVVVGGEALSGDTLRMETLALTFTGTVLEKGVRNAELRLQTPFLNTIYQGSFENQTPGPSTLRLNLDAGSLLSQLPKTAALPEGLAITHGRVTLNTDVSFSDGKPSGAVSFALEDLKGTRENAPIALSAPITASFMMGWVNDLPRLDALKLDAGFLRAHGAGTVDNLEISLEGDIAAAMAQIAPFVELDGLSASGKVNATILSRKDGDDEPLSTRASVRFTGLNIRQKDAVIAANEDLTLAATARIALGENGVSSIPAARLEYDFPFGRGMLIVAGFVPSAHSNEFPTVEHIKLTGNLDLQALGKRLAAMHLLPKDTNLDGLIEQISLDASLQGQQISLRSLDVQAKGIDVQSGTQRVRLAMANISGSGMVNNDTGAVALQQVVVRIPGLNVNLPYVTIPDKDELPAGISLQATGDIDLEKMFQLASGISTNLPLTSLQGAGTFSFRLEPSEWNISTSIQPLRATWKEGEGGSYEDERVALALKVSPRFDLGRYVIANSTIQSSLLNLDVAGDIQTLGEHAGVSLEGRLAYDLARWMPLLEAAGVEDIRIAGKSESPFTFVMPLGERTPQEIQQGTSLSVELLVPELDLYGFQARSIQVPIAISQGLIRVVLSAEVENGKVAIDATVDTQSDIPVLMLSTNKPALTRLPLTPELADKLLARIHPAFKGANQATGFVSLSWAEFHIPLSAAWQQDARIKGTLLLEETRFVASGIVESALQLAKINERTAEVGTRTIGFKAEKGRMSADPLELRIRNQPVVFAGSIGFDQTVAYTASLPITQELVGSTVFPYIKDNEIRLGIGGTVSKPVLDRDAFQREVARLSKVAGSRVVEEKAEDLLLDLLNKRRKKE